MTQLPFSWHFSLPGADKKKPEDTNLRAIAVEHRFVN
jgi:hypothetical protein